MKKSLALLLLVFVAQISFAQKNAPVAPVVLPVDSITKLITYEGVLEAKGVGADALYQRALTWFRGFYKNPGEVIRENDSIKLKITGKPRFKIYNAPDKTGLKTEAGLVQYTITLAVKDGRFRYELTEFNWKQLSYYPCERWMDTKSQTYLPVYNDYLTQVDGYVKDLVAKLHEAMTHEKPVKDRDNW